MISEEDNENAEKIAFLGDEEVEGVREDENGYLRNMSSQEEETAADGDESRSGRLEQLEEVLSESGSVVGVDKSSILGWLKREKNVKKDKVLRSGKVVPTKE